MMDFIMTWLLRILCYGFQLGILLLIAAALTLPLARGRRKTTAILLAVYLLMECAVICFWAYHPIVYIPEEYAPYVSREEIVSYNNGFYSANIPVFSGYIEVLYADAQEALVRTQYFFFGTTEMSITADGPGITKPLFPWA